MKNLITLFFTLACLLGYAKKDKEPLKQVSINDLKEKYCPIDSNAHAYIISDEGKTRFVVGSERIEYVFEKKTRIKILDKEGYNEATNYIRLYYGEIGNETIEKFEARSYTLENNQIVITELDEDDLFEDDHKNKWHNKKFTLPNIKEGSIIEYTYTIYSPYLFVIPGWYFQHEIPVLKSNYSLHMCPLYEYMIMRNGFMEYNLDTSYIDYNAFSYRGKYYDVSVFEWELHNVPAFKKEAYITTRNDYIMRVHFQLTKAYNYDGTSREYSTTWSKMTQELLKDEERFGYYLKSKKIELENILAGMNLPANPGFEDALTIVQYMKDNYRWNGMYGITASQKKGAFLKNKNGSVADINLCLVSLLQTAGFDASPVLLSTREHGMVFHHYPFLNNFNYVAASVTIDNGSICLDATEPLLPNHLLPAKCLNGFSIVVQKLKKDMEPIWFDLTPTLLSTNTSITILQLNPDKEIITGRYNLSLTAYKAFEYREFLNKHHVNELPNLLVDKFEGVVFTEIEVQNENEIDNKLQVKTKIELPLETMDDLIFISPLLFDAVRENKFKADHRDFPVDFNYKKGSLNRVSFAIPENYAVDYLPDDYNLIGKDKMYIFGFQVQEINGTIQVLSQIYINRQSYDASDYSDLKHFFEEIVKKHNEKIVLKRIEKKN